MADETNFHERVNNRLLERGIVLNYDTKEGAIKYMGLHFKVNYFDGHRWYGGRLDPVAGEIYVQKTWPVEVMCDILLHELTHVDNLPLDIAVAAAFLKYTFENAEKKLTRRGFIKVLGTVLGFAAYIHPYGARNFLVDSEMKLKGYAKPEADPSIWMVTQ